LLYNHQKFIANNKKKRKSIGQHHQTTSVKHIAMQCKVTKSSSQKVVH